MRNPAKIVYYTHNPILIDGNAGFTNASGVVWGSGTEADPFIIEGWDITGPRGVTRISILNADAHFIIRGCSLHDSEASYGGSGVGLTTCRNGTIEACTSFNHDEGIIVRQSTGIVVRDCYCFNNSRGISASGSELCLVTNNTCAGGNQYGIYLEDGSGNNTAIGNNCSYNDETGISMSNTWNNMVSYNMCERGSRGFEVSGARSNTITNNLCRFNDEQGIYLYGTDNSVFDNDCSNNFGDGIYLILSSNNTLINNTCTNNINGIYLSAANNNTLIDNNCSHNSFNDMALYDSNKNTITDNNCSSSGYNGVILLFSNNNTLFKNTCNSNFYVGIGLT